MFLILPELFSLPPLLLFLPLLIHLAALFRSLLLRALALGLALFIPLATLFLRLAFIVAALLFSLAPLLRFFVPAVFILALILLFPFFATQSAVFTVGGLLRAHQAACSQQGRDGEGYQQNEASSEAIFHGDLLVLGETEERDSPAPIAICIPAIRKLEIVCRFRHGEHELTRYGYEINGIGQKLIEFGGTSVCPNFSFLCVPQRSPRRLRLSDFEKHLPQRKAEVARPQKLENFNLGTDSFAVIPFPFRIYLSQAEKSGGLYEVFCRYRKPGRDPSGRSAGIG